MNYHQAKTFTESREWRLLMEWLDYHRNQEREELSRHKDLHLIYRSQGRVEAYSRLLNAESNFLHWVSNKENTNK